MVCCAKSNATWFSQQNRTLANNFIAPVHHLFIRNRHADELTIREDVFFK